jgi:predicted ArsR family transcriptional regulator
VLGLDAENLRFSVVQKLDGSRRKLTAEALYRHLEQYGPLPLKELAEQLGVSQKTVKTNMAELEIEGAVSMETGTHGKHLYQAVPGFFGDENAVA